MVILAIILGAGYYILKSLGLADQIGGFGGDDKIESNEGEANSGITDNSSDAGNSKAATRTPRSSDDNTLRVQLVTWGGYAPGLLYNEGHLANTASRFYKDYGFKVEFMVENDLINAMDAWIAGEYDVLVQTADAFPLYTAPADINQYGPTAFMQVDWSRGGDAIIAKRGISSVNDLKGKTVAVTVPSPSQTLLITSLEAAGLDYSDVKVEKTVDNFKAAELFRSGDIDAAVVWSPDDQLAVADVPGSKVLLTTAEQSHIIADIMFAKRSFINENKEMIDGFYEGWMKAVSELDDPVKYNKAAGYMAELFQLGAEDAKGMMSTVKWTTHGDNQNFFGLNRGFKGQKGADLYGKMSKKFKETGDLENEGPNWRSVIYTGAIQSAKGLAGVAFAPEKAPDFKPTTKADRTAAPIASKPISISFNTGQYALTPNAKTIIDFQFASIAKSFANSKVRVEGNTDNVGGLQANIKLSERRAKAVADYLQAAYDISPNRFVVVGNGPSKPVSGCETNATKDCQAKNRRTEFQIIGG